MAMVGEDLRGIPLDVFKGIPEREKDENGHPVRKNYRRLRSVRNVYEANYIEKLLEILWEAFWDKTPSKTSDQFGIEWDDITNWTHREKLKLAEESPESYPPLSGTVRTRRMFSPSQYNTFAGEIKRLTGFVSKSTVARTAYAKANQEIDVGGPRTPVNVRTGRLVAAFFPGAVSVGRLYSGPDRICEWVGVPPRRELKFEITVDYADEVDEVRTLLPDDPSEIKAIAHDHAIEIAAERYRTIMLQSGLTP